MVTAQAIEPVLPSAGTVWNQVASAAACDLQRAMAVVVALFMVDFLGCLV